MDWLDEGVYSIGAVAKMLGVPAKTLRNWEFRYGQVVPPRSEGGQRLYSRNQVDQLNFLLGEVSQGRQPAEAHRLLELRSRLPADPARDPTADPEVRPSPTILLAERDRYAAELCEYLLRTEGYTTRTAMSAGAARELLAEEPLSLAVIDLLISGGAGVALCTQAREQRLIPVVAVSALASPDQAIEAGADAFLRKPLESLQLVSTVRQLLGATASWHVRFRGQ